MESIISFVKRRLRDVGPPEWGAIASKVGVAKSVPRKLAYERESSVIKTIEPLYRYFLQRDYGSSALPHERPPVTKKG